MGQYYILVNVDKKEYCNAHDLGGMSKFTEWCTSPQSFAFPYLLGLCDGSGGGDVEVEGKKYLGRWAGDRVVLVGDYWHWSDKKKPFSGLYREVHDNDLENCKGYVKRLKESVKSLRTRGGECYMNSPEDREKMAVENEQRIIKEQKHIDELKKKPRKERYINISAAVKAEFEGIFGKDALDWEAEVKPVMAADMVLTAGPGGGGISTDKDALAEHKADLDNKSA